MIIIWANKIKKIAQNRQEITGKEEVIIDNHYTTCGPLSDTAKEENDLDIPIEDT